MGGFKRGAEKATDEPVAEKTDKTEEAEKADEEGVELPAERKPEANKVVIEATGNPNAVVVILIHMRQEWAGGRSQLNPRVSSPSKRA
jgi:hypothetical protein